MLAVSNQTILQNLLRIPGLQQTAVDYDATSTRKLAYEMHTLVYGGLACSAIKRCELIGPAREGPDTIAPESATMYLADGCLEVSAEQQAECRTVGGGVMNSGLQAAIARIGSVSRQFLVSFVGSNRTEANALEHSLVRQLTEMTHPHARAGFARATAHLIDSTLAVLIDGQNIALTATWVFALVYMGVTAIWLSSQVTQLAWPLRTARRLVRFLPADLILAVPNLRHGLREVAAGVRTKKRKREWCKWKCCSKPSRRVAIADAPATSTGSTKSRS
ncbi:hypothetical protein FNF31_03068 [Cafeteria roenbergensis]|uniref:Uncharacterized protein n=1 Tax=Cafeteria roenbergensis TaxID=33653 RepID=A0A5A8DBW9_CAFRO|nr:hypothetical protein FNF31_03068 [Cafeteria roenbergensis]